MKSLLTALALLILVTVPAYAWEEGRFLCTAMLFGDGSGNKEPFIIQVMEDRLVFDLLEGTPEAILMKKPPSSLDSENDGSRNANTKLYYLQTGSEAGFELFVVIQGSFPFADLVLERQSWYGNFQHNDARTNCRKLN